MNRFFGFSRNAVALVGIVIAIVLVVLVGMIMIGSAAIRGLTVPGAKVEGVSLLALLVTIIVLLSAVFVVLLLLLWCCCRSQGKHGEVPPNVLATLLPLLPVIQQVPDLLRDVGQAMYEAGKALAWVQGNLNNAALQLNALAEVARTATTLRIPAIAPSPDGLFLVAPSFAPVDINPLEVLDTNLRRAGLDVAGLDLEPTRTFPVTYGSTGVTLSGVSDSLIEAGRALAQAADRLHATPRPHDELL